MVLEFRSLTRAKIKVLAGLWSFLEALGGSVPRPSPAPEAHVATGSRPLPPPSEPAGAGGASLAANPAGSCRPAASSFPSSGPLRAGWAEPDEPDHLPVSRQLVSLLPLQPPCPSAIQPSTQIGRIATGVVSLCQHSELSSSQETPKDQIHP